MAVAISHSCDIANEDLEKEPSVEFVVAAQVETMNGNLTHAKNPRVLHLPVACKEKSIGLKLHATQKISIAKEDLQSHSPDPAYRVAAKDLQVLQAWLAARYDRQALPDSLQSRLQPLVKTMEKHGRSHPLAVLGYWLDYQPRNELADGEDYEIYFFVVHSLEQEDYANTAIGIAKSIRATLDSLTGLDVRECEACSEEEFTLQNLRECVAYRLEHLSYRLDPPGPTI
jgi:hypothetical protein